MPEIYRNGRNYGAAMPNGGLLGQALIKLSNGDGDVGWGDAGGAVFCYVIGNTPYAADWLSTTPTGQPLTPNAKLLYLILSEGQYYHNFVRWDTTNSIYVPVSDGGGVIINATLLASGWNSTTKQQTLTFTGYQASMGGVIGMPSSATAAQKEAYSASVIDIVAQSGSQFTFECQTIPAVDLPVTIYAGGGGSGGGGAGGGHVIVNSAGTELEQREKLKFTGGATVTDDSANETTVVDVSSKSDLTNLAPAFDHATPYVTGDRVTYNGKIYRFTDDHTGAWDIADVDEVDVDTELDGVSNSVKTVSDNVGKLADLTTTHKTNIVEAVNELDDDKQDVIMKSTMPNASVDLVGKTFQYTGATNNDFKHNYFYECVNDGGTYKWENSKVQDTVTVDSALSDTSENPVQNKVIKGALSEKQDVVFVGTHLAWSALSDADKAKFNLVNFTDDALSDRISPLTGYTPIGTVISIMGTQAPRHYLKCDGTVYNISSYPELADYFEGQFGTKNHFGGDGTTTFAVPDLQGEFLRGAGTNSHTDQGSGGTVGEHQDGSVVAENMIGATVSYLRGFSSTSTGDNYVTNIANYDSTPSLSIQQTSGINITRGAATQPVPHKSVRPTNTSVLYCIATKDIYIDPAHNYSLNEQVIGTWIDGKPLYQKTFVNDSLTVVGETTTTLFSLSGLNINEVVSTDGVFYRPDINDWSSINQGTNNTNYCISAWVRGTNIVYYMGSGNAGRYTKARVTIQYTKTTD